MILPIILFIWMGIVSVVGHGIAHEPKNVEAQDYYAHVFERKIK